MVLSLILGPKEEVVCRRCGVCNLPETIRKPNVWAQKQDAQGNKTSGWSHQHTSVKPPRVVSERNRGQSPIIHRVVRYFFYTR